jgi:Fe-S-cluster containining protein
MSDNMTPVSAETPFGFLCDKCVSCFNECCRDLNQFLTPYDILRIKTGLNISSSEFLAQYCKQHTGPESGFPIITLKPIDAVDLKCPFVTPTGCRIYDNRPSSCRMYPLARPISRNRESGKITEQYMLMKEPHCRGFEQDNHQTFNQWIFEQGLQIFNELNDMLMDVISIKNQCAPGPMDLATGRLFYLACYDLDNFRPHLFIKGVLNNLKIDPDMLEMAKSDDEALLKIGMDVIKQTLLQRNR